MVQAPVAVEEAGRTHDWRETAYLVGTPQFGNMLEEGVAKLGYSCKEFEIERL